MTTGTTNTPWYCSCAVTTIMPYEMEWKGVTLFQISAKLNNHNLTLHSIQQAVLGNLFMQCHIQSARFSLQQKEYGILGHLTLAETVPTCWRLLVVTIARFLIIWYNIECIMKSLQPVLCKIFVFKNQLLIHFKFIVDLTLRSTDGRTAWFRNGSQSIISNFSPSLGLDSNH